MAGKAAGLKPIKINMVVMGGINEDEVEDMVEFCIEHDFNLRLIETMPVGDTGRSASGHYVDLQTVKARLARRFDLVDWVMVRSVNDHDCPLDVALVEGVVATRRDLAELRRIRERTEVLVAIGTCAVWGGLPAMRNDLPREVLQREVYHDVEIGLDTVEARPITDFVEVDPVADRDDVACDGNTNTYSYHGHEVVAEVRSFLNYPTHFFAECQAVNAYENTVPNPGAPHYDDPDF